MSEKQNPTLPREVAPAGVNQSAAAVNAGAPSIDRHKVAAEYHLRDDGITTFTEAEAEQAAAASRAALGIGSPLEAMAARDAGFAELASRAHFSAVAAERQQEPAQEQAAAPAPQPVQSSAAEQKPELGRWTALVNRLRTNPTQERGR